MTMRIVDSNNARGSISTSAARSSWAARRASYRVSSSLRTFFPRIFSHSAMRSSGAISFARLRNASARCVPTASITHLTAASMTSLFSAPHVPRAAVSLKGSLRQLTQLDDQLLEGNIHRAGPA